MMTDDFPLDPNSILRGLRAFYSDEINKQEFDLLRRAQAEITYIPYDDWDGRISYSYCLHLRVPPSSYRHIAEKQQAFEEKLLEKAQILLRPYPQHAFVQVCITPTLPEDETKVQPENNFIEATWIPDEFYRKLIHEINALYTHDLPISIPILLRKLFENLIIDILRKKYGTSELSLYFDPSKSRFHDLSVLLKNLKSKKSDFNYITSSLNDSFINELNRYREKGNAAAHSIDINITTEQLKSDKDKINYIVQLLLRVLQHI